MSRSLAVLLAAVCVACSGGSSSDSITQPPKPKAVDPAISIHVLDQLDTTTAVGRASWVIFPLLYSADPNKSGVGFTGAIGLADVRLGHTTDCVGYDADSIGARQVIVLAVADTVNGTQTDAAAQAVANQYFAGNRTLPAGWMAIRSDSLDWGVSAQFNAGHGLTRSDPVRWRLTWSGSGTVAAAESPSDTVCP